jgi:ADP-heptose:LPS heptosyltransferase
MLTHPIDRNDGPHSSAHRSEYFLAVAKELGISWPARVRLHYQITPEESEQARRLIREWKVEPDRQILTAIHPGTSRIHLEKRRWALDRFIEVGRFVVRQPDAKLILVGGPEEKEAAEAFNKAMAGMFVDLSGRLSLREFAAVLQQCQIAVTNDSAPVHLAGAVGTSVLAIFGYQNSKIWGPLGGGGRVIRLDLPCSPCPPEYVCDRSFECLHKLESQTVIEALGAMLHQLRASQISCR